MTKREFTVEGEYRYNRASPVRWIVSHVLRYPWLPLGMVLGSITSNSLMSYSRVLIGDAFTWVTQPDPAVSALLRIALLVLGARLVQAGLELSSNVFVELLAQRLERDSREELYISLLGKSLTFHGRQRVGDIMARATNDVRELNFMVSPGVSLIFDSLMGVVVPIVAIATLRLELLLVPLLFVLGLTITLRDYLRQLNPISDAIREQFGRMNADLAEAISGIEVVKVNAQEEQERRKFGQNARVFRDLFVERGRIQARYLPFLVYSVAFGAALWHALLVYLRGDGFGIGQVISYLGLFATLRFPTFLSLFSFTLVQMGVAGAERILALLNTETELDENPHGVAKPIAGEVVFEHVTFGYGDAPILKDISFRAAPGETVAIVGETGSGKTTLTRLINRVYDVNQGRVLVDGVDVRDWQMASLRSQISTIEQDVFLFSRSIAENIAFGVGLQAPQERIEEVAKEAQAHDFITSFAEGYRSEVGERGVTLSGGQRQRIAIARAFMTDPRILILDDSTSAIDSATEDQIQKAMYRAQKGRTTFLITHRLSQIRWADRILVLRRGRLVDQGTHEELMARSSDYRRIFGRYEGRAA